jgi:hypothetical protein
MRASPIRIRNGTPNGDENGRMDGMGRVPS